MNGCTQTTLAVARFTSLFATALALGLAAAHALEMPAKMGLSANEYVIVQHIYQRWGLAGAIIEPLALISTATVAVLVRSRRVTFGLTLLGLVCIVGTVLVFAFGNAPANGEIATWSVHNVSSDWREVRRVWEYSHLTSFGLAVVAFAALLLSAVRDSVPAARRRD